MADEPRKTYALKDNTFTIRQTTVEEKATGNPRGHLAGQIGDVIIEFPFDCAAYDDIYAGHTFTIPLPGVVFAEHFEESGEVEPEMTATAAEESPYGSWTVEELKDELGKRNLPTSGNKAELVARLEQDDEANAEEEE